ncbi:MAG: sigma-70 family RNA polymerase sigma factor [Saprospiraceae bacterium]|nr:sigma-70 family RNA polymerase sigma factor [Saprospiraceae bacterium]
MLRFFRPEGSEELGDDELLLRYRREGDLEILAELYDRYLEMVYGLCLKYLASEAAAEDAVMSIFEELVVKLMEHEVQNFRSWLYVLARNHCLMRLRKEKKHIRVKIEPEFMQKVEPMHPVTEEGIAEADLDQLRDCLDKLSDDQMKCIEQFYYEDKSYREIAADNSITLGKVRSHIQNGRRNLRICMEQKREENRSLR